MLFFFTGETCGEGNNLGTCVLLQYCPTGLNQVEQEKTHHLERCGFQGNDDIVCCPDYKTEGKPPNKIRPDIPVWDVVPIDTRDGSNGGERRSVAGR